MCLNFLIVELDLEQCTWFGVVFQCHRTDIAGEVG